MKEGERFISKQSQLWAHVHSKGKIQSPQLQDGPAIQKMNRIKMSTLPTNIPLSPQ